LHTGFIIPPLKKNLHFYIGIKQTASALLRDNTSKRAFFIWSNGISQDSGDPFSVLRGIPIFNPLDVEGHFSGERR